MFKLFPKKEKFYGSYRGIVTNNNDPKQLRRCKVRVYPMMAKVDITLVPWAVNKDNRFVDIPELGAKVWVEFENGDIMQPIYSGYICDPDNDTIPGEAKTDYPRNKVMKLGKHTIKFNDKTGDFTYEHTSGAIVQVDENGGIAIHSADNETIRLDTNDKVVLGAKGRYIVTAPAPGAVADVSVLLGDENIGA